MDDCYSGHFAFLVGVCGGCAGILPDIDHPLKILFDLGDPRFLHMAFFAIACSVIFGCFSYLAGLYIEAILKK